MKPVLRTPRRSALSAHRHARRLNRGVLIWTAVLLAGLAIPSIATAQQRASRSTTAAQAPSKTKSPPQSSHSPAASLIRNILAEDPGGQVDGEPISLLVALESSTQRRQQLRAVQDYWRLAAAVGDYNAHLVAYRLISDLSAADAPSTSRDRRAGDDQRHLQQQRDDAHARMERAREDVFQQQRTLAQTLRRPSSQPLPLPADLPHSAVYFTRYNEIFSGRTPPPPAILMQRLLPLEHRAVDLRTAAATAAEDAWEAVREGYAEGHFDVHSAIDAWGRFVEQQQAFLAIVGRYNQAIAEYALAVAPQNASPADLRAMLIRTADSASTSLWRQGEESWPGDYDRRPVEPAQYYDRRFGQRDSDGYDAAVEYDDATSDFSESTTNLRQPPRGFDDEPHIRPLPPPETGPDDSYLVPADEAPDETRPATHRNTLRPPSYTASRDEYRQGAGAGDLRVAQAPGAPRESNDSGDAPELPTAARPLDTTELAELPPYRRSQRLAVQLASDDRQDSARWGQPLDLQTCLQQAPAQRRREAVAAYWSARRALSDWQSQRRLLGQVEALIRDRLSVRGELTGPALALLLQAARAAARADAAAAEADWVAAQFQLTQEVGGKIDAEWLYPITPPHGGRYVTNTRDATRAVANLQQLDRSLAAAALDVVDSNQQADALVRRLTSAQDLQAALAAVQRQADHTRHFLNELNRYNVAIADYALGVLPTQANAAQLVSALVVTRGGRQQ